MSAEAEPAILYVVATPIGNMGDMTFRAVEVLRSVSLIACEDTRHTAKLLANFQIKTPTISYHEHNEEQRIPQLLKRLTAGESLALVSDAGTPLLSDPGYRLVNACRQGGIRVTAVPGPFAAAAAASISGLSTDRIVFAGFPPGRPGSQHAWWRELATIPASVVCYLSPHRLLPSLRAAAAVFGSRPAFLVRELTKLHEESFFAPLDELVQRLHEHHPRGEYTLVIGGVPQSTTSLAIDLESYVTGLQQARGLSLSQAVARASSELGIPRRQLYRQIHIGRTKSD
ncbi:MAG TPA: 16S rRNA (cytidine(1402)-2'-O)-methyltransferase [Acidobacteriota bacterium]|nr:16S rRNA (cytidine(1402)-2'-O)-methyltransferase [Acidobacteriota bacterium]HRR55729.1 16S rRNA (cytidine(1402)-2'-O)-methyltransferase [Acidobacteriota bacterium]HRV06981.1 16S rRNA (cytidine(1402)-2'-O)-methyltransferase [Acidobacteriota bacterium]